MGTRGNRKLDGREAFALLPKGHGTRCEWVYAIGLSDGRIKLGLSGRPRERFSQHWRVYGPGIQWAHVFAPIRPRMGRPGFHIERRALELVSAHGQCVEGKEVFSGVCKATVLSLVRQAYAELG